MTRSVRSLALLRRGLAVCLTAAAMAQAQAHEFWLLPDEFVLRPGGSTALSMSVGEYFAGDRIGISQPLIASFRQFGDGRVVDLSRTVSTTVPVGELPVAVGRAGTHLFAVDTQPASVVLAPDKFNAYLHDEGLGYIAARREAAGTAATPARERFRRNIKTLLQAGAKPDATHAVRTGQRLELLPLANPYRLRPGRDFGLQVLFEGQPLANALVKAWHRRDGQTLIIRTLTGNDGKVTVTLPWAGTWMVSVVHMIPVTDSPDHDWDSFWGNLTFELPARASGP